MKARRLGCLQLTTDGVDEAKFQVYYKAHSLLGPHELWDFSPTSAGKSNHL